MRENLNSGWQIVKVDVADFSAHSLQHIQGIFTFAQKNNSLHHIVFIHLRWLSLTHAAQSWTVADDHFANASDGDGCAVASHDGDGLDVLLAPHKTKPAHDIH